MGKIRKTVKQHEGAKNAPPAPNGIDAQHLLREGEALFAKEDIDGARIAFLRTLAVDPGQADALNNLGVVAFAEGALEESQNYFLKALENSPDHPDALLNLAKLHEAKGAHLDALNGFMRSLRVGGPREEILASMARCFIELDDRKTARTVLEEILKEAPDHEEALETLSRVDAHVNPRAGTKETTARKLRVGFVTIWFERGQSYVTKMIRDVIAPHHETFVFARTGGVYGKPMLQTDGAWNVPGLTTYPDYEIPGHVIQKWIRDNRLDAVIFNEEYDWNLVHAAKKTGARVLTYLDYYKNDWKPQIGLYDAVLCSTRRSYELVRDVCRAHYIGWAVDNELFQPRDENGEKFTFFHNAGWLGINYRKMTPAAIVAFDAVSKHLPHINFFIHSQAEMELLPPEIIEKVRNNPRITYHVETVPAPGYYHKGRIMVFPTKLEGLGLPLFEALACGLPVIATDAPPMNEFIRHGENGLLVRVGEVVTRQDDIAFPETLIDVRELALKMASLAQDPGQVRRLSHNARRYAERELSPQALGTRICRILDALLQEGSGHCMAQSASVPVCSRTPATDLQIKDSAPVIHLVGAQETNYPWGFENRLIPALEELGCTVISTDFRKNRDRLPVLLQTPADLLLVCKGEGIEPRWIRQAPCTTALWYAEQVGFPGQCDDTAAGRRKELASNIGAFDHAFSHDEGNLDVYRALGARSASWLPTAMVDPQIHRPLGLAKDIDVIFVGSITPRRKTLLEAVQRRVNVHVANTWDPEETNRLFNRSKIVLNIHLSDLPNTETRIAEVLGAGAFLLTEALSSPSYLIDGKHAVSFPLGDVETLASKIVYFLNHEDEREAIAAAGHAYVTEHHTFGARVRQILQQSGRTRRTDGAAALPEGRRERTASPKGVEGPKRLRIFTAFAHVNWEDQNLIPALESFGNVVRFRWDFNSQYASDWHSAGKIALNTRLLEAVQAAHREKPIDLFFSYLSGRLAFPGIIRAIGMLGIPTLNLSLDDKTKFFGALEGTGYAGVGDIAGAFTLCWTSTEDSVKLYEAVGARAIYLPEGANPDVYRRISGIDHDIDVSFIGQSYGQRPKILEYLKSRGIQVEAYGRGWPSGEISVEKMVEIYNRSRINLGFAAVGETTNVYNLKGRDFEVPMSGGLYLTEYHPELENVYRIGSEILCYRTPDDLADTIAHFLDHPGSAKSVRCKGHRRAMAQHTWRQRFAEAFRQLGLRFDEHDVSTEAFGASPDDAMRGAKVVHF